jgi:hypothetical protein
MESTSSEDMKHKVVEYYNGAPQGKNNTQTMGVYNLTGYTCRKYIHPRDARTGNNPRVINKTFPIIRYAEVLMIYAEALNNLTKSHTIGGETFSRDEMAMATAFNQVRYRAGLPGLTDAEVASHEAFQPVLEQERMIELLCENHRYFDVRRWGIYEREENITIQGMNIDGDKDTFYQVVVPNTSRIGSRLVHKKLYLLPIPLAEIRRLPSCDQNPGWED